MSSERDGQGRGGDGASTGLSGTSGDLDSIKILLRQLEEVAARDSEAAIVETSVLAPTAPVAPAQQPDVLASLQRGSLVVRQPAALMPVLVAASEFPAIETPTAAAPRGRGWALAAASFVLGIAAAGGVIVAFDPLKQALRGPDVARQQAAPPVPSPAAISVPEIARAPTPPVPVPAVVAQSPVDAASAPTSSVPVSLGAQPSATPVAVPAAPSAQAAQAAVGRYRLGVSDRLALRAGERRQLDISLTPQPEESARLLVVLRNVPEWLSLSKGGAIGNEIWLLPAHQAGDASIELGPGAKGSADIKVQLASMDGQIISETTLAVRVTAPSSSAPAMTASVPAQPVPLPDDTMILRLQARGELLLDTGEVEAARTLFRGAAEAGSVSAALRLAETYDPQEMQRLGMNLGAADPVQAVRWYERAHALGSPVAAARLANLGRR